MAIDPGTQAARFLPQRWWYRSVTRYRVKVGLSVHEYVLSFCKATRRRRRFKVS